MRDLDRQVVVLREQQASAWVSALGKPDSGQYTAFVDWLKESPLNVREFLFACAIEQSLEQLDARHLSAIDGLLKEFDPGLAQVHSIGERVASQASKPSSQHALRRYAVAAGVVAAVIAGWWTLSNWQPGWRTFQTGIGEQRALQLEDGSVVYLNANSRVALNFSGNTRDVKLIDGEALFKVHHDANRLFRVFVRDAVIRDIGTQFNVYSRSDGMKIAVIEGSVEVTAQPAASGTGRGQSSNANNLKRPVTRILVANEQARLDHQGDVTVSALQEGVEPVAWQQRRLVFHDEPLSHIVDEFNRYNHRPIRLKSEALGSRAYTGAFDADDPDSLVSVLADDPEITIAHSDEEIVIERRAAGASRSQ